MLRNGLQQLLTSVTGISQPLGPVDSCESSEDETDPARRVAYQLAERSNDDPSLPARIRTALRRGYPDSLIEVLRSSDADLLAVRSIGGLALEALDAWVESTSGALGRSMSRQEVRLILALDRRSLVDDRLDRVLQRLPAAVLELPVSMLDVSKRVVNMLASRRWIKIGDMLGQSAADLAAEPGMGSRSVEDLELALQELAQRAASLGRGGELAGDALCAALVAGKEFRANLGERLARLSARQQEVLQARVMTLVPTTLEVVGGRYGVTRERVRQIEAKGLRVLDPGGNLCRLVDARLERVWQQGPRPLGLGALCEKDSYFAGIDSDPGPLRGFLLASRAKHRLVEWPELGWSVVPRCLEHPDRVRTAVRGALRDNAAMEPPAAILDRFVVELDPESIGLVPVVAQLLGMVPSIGGGWQWPPSRREKILGIMIAAARAMSVEEVIEHLAVASDEPTSESMVRLDLDTMRTVDHSLARAGRSAYIAVALLDRWESRLDMVRAHLVPLLQADPAIVMSTEDLLRRARLELPAWPQDLPAPALEMLLFRCEGIQFIGRWMWQALHVSAPKPTTVAELAGEILTAHEGPMRRRDLLVAMSQRRSLGINPVYGFPVFSDAGYVYLIDRDMGIPPAVYRSWFEAVSAELEIAAGGLDGAALERILQGVFDQQHGAEPKDLLAMLGSESRFYYDREHQLIRFAAHMRRP